MKKIFTIIIPTYNRSKYLERNLESLLPKVELFSDRVSVYISDNASDDNTQEVVGKYQKQYPELLSYFRQEKNLGAHANFRDAAKRVTTKYVTLLGDDDAILPTYIEKVLSIIDCIPDVGLINVNALSVNNHGVICGFRDSMFCYSNGKLYNSGADFLMEHNSIPSLVSSNIFNRQLFVDASDKIKLGTYPGYDWFAQLFLSVLDAKCYYCDIPQIVQYMQDHVRWLDNYPYYQLVGLGRSFKLFDTIRPGLYEMWVKKQNTTRLPINILNIVQENRSIYKPRLGDMLEYSINEEYSRRLKYIMSHSDRYINWHNSIKQRLDLFAGLFGLKRICRVLCELYGKLKGH